MLRCSKFQLVEILILLDRCVLGRPIVTLHFDFNRSLVETAIHIIWQVQVFSLFFIDVVVA